MSAKRGTPVNALVVFMIIGLVGCFGWALIQGITPIVLFAEPSTLGTILVIIAYAVANLSLPIFYLKHTAASSASSGISSCRSSARRSSCIRSTTW